MTTIQKKSLKVGKQVNTKHVDTVIKNYKRERWVHNSKRLGKEDSLSVWYSIEELEEFMAMAKAQGGDGIRLYFGAYDQDHKDNPVFSGRQTVALVATKHKTSRKGESNKDIYITTENGSSILAWNAGHICPPYCGTKDDFDDLGITIVDKGEEGLAIV